MFQIHYLQSKEIIEKVWIPFKNKIETGKLKEVKRVLIY